MKPSLPPDDLLELANQQAATLTHVAAVFLGLSWLMVGTWLWVRHTIVKCLGSDDWAMVAIVVLCAVIVYTGYCASMLVVNTYNPQLMLNALPFSEIEHAYKYQLAGMALYIATTIIFKVALGLFYLRIMPQPWQRRTIYATLGAAVTILTAFFFYTIFQCGSPAHFLLKELELKCVGRDTLWSVLFTGSLVNAITDWVLALLPLIVLARSQMSLASKMSAGSLLLLGAAGSACSIGRLVYIDGLLPGIDFFWNQVACTTWSICECGLAISAGSAATLRPLFRAWIGYARRHPPSIRTPTAMKFRKTASSSTDRSHDDFVPLSNIESSRSGFHKGFHGGGTDLDVESAHGDTMERIISNTREVEKIFTPDYAVRLEGVRRPEESRKPGRDYVGRL